MLQNSPETHIAKEVSTTLTDDFLTLSSFDNFENVIKIY